MNLTGWRDARIQQTGFNFPGNGHCLYQSALADEIKHAHHAVL
jgi:hypothetical protein